ncbi:MAG TPA: response regulator [Terriglobia bacterium]|jgi:signal transduction histidine kinase
MRDQKEVSHKTLRLLIVEDNPIDVELLVYSLKAEGYIFEYDVVHAPDAFRQHWSAGSYDVVLADNNLPNWTGMEALKLLQELGKDAPFIVVTGSLGDESAVDYIKQGASDYVLKSRLNRLPLSIDRALREQSNREERKALEEELRQAQKMEAIGRLAGGIAHDFNNLLTVILGRSELLIDLLADQTLPLRHAGEIHAASEQAASLTRQLLAFSRKQTIQHEVVDLNAIIRKLHPMLERLIPENIQLTSVLTSRHEYIKVNPTQIEQVLLNLVVNARDAMPAGGMLTIQTSAVVLPDLTKVHQLDAKPGNYMVLTVTDTGTGMDAEVLDHLFEPFYTTKQPGKGTGLGLPTVYGIVKQSGGSIIVQSQPHIGTTFSIYLPRTDKAPKSSHARRPAMENRGETVFVVEDNETVRELTNEILELKGYRVLSAGGPGEAVTISNEFQGPIDLLLTDVVMPEGSGPALAERLTKLRPDMKVLYMSGYTAEMISQQGILEGSVALVMKPFTTRELMNKVHEVLGDASFKSTALQKRSHHA